MLIHFSQVFRISINVLREKNMLHLILKIDNILTSSTNRRQKDNSLFNGMAGEIVLFNYLYALTNKSKYRDIILILASRIFKKISDNTHDCSLGIGLCGIHYAIRQSVSLGILEIDKESDLQIKNAIEKSLESDFANENIDLIYGAIGKGVYLLDYEKSKIDHQSITKIINQIDKQKILDNEGIFWHQSFSNLHNSINLGLAHGISSIIQFLAKCYFNKIEEKKCLELIEFASNWIVSKSKNKLFPSILVDGEVYEKNNYLSWCHGNAGIALSLISAYYVTKKIIYLKNAKDVSTKIAKIRISNLESDVNPYLCHGSSGFALLLHKLFKVFKDQELKIARDYWNDYSIKIFKQKTIFSNFGLLEGVYGMILSSLSISNPIEDNNWEDIFLINPYTK